MSLAKAALEINGVWDELQADQRDTRPTVFISYARPDQALVEGLVILLGLYGYRAWWDSHIACGAVFADRIERELTASVAVLVIWSEHSVKSDWVAWEANQAAKQGKLVPVAAAGFDLRDIRPPFNGLNTLRIGDEGHIIDEVRRTADFR